jgi:hypothetical protein
LTSKRYILIRDVGLDTSGKLDNTTINLAVNLKIPHHQGAGGEDDFVLCRQRNNSETKQKKKKRRA